MNQFLVVLCVLIVSFAITFAAFLIGVRYEIVRAGNTTTPTICILDRVDGTVGVCILDKCRPARFAPAVKYDPSA